MSTRPVGLSNNHVAAVRTVTGSPVAADAEPYVDASFPPSPDPTTGGAINAAGFATVWVGLEFVGGNSPSATIMPLVRDDGAPDGARWKNLSVGGRVIFPVLSAVAGTPTQVTVLAFPGRVLGGVSVDT
jgi:hypothetical protein